MTEVFDLPALWSHEPREELMFGPGDLVSDIDANTTPGFRGGKLDAPTLQAERNIRFAELQEMLYANSRSGDTRSILLVLQGMDTAGKDGAVRGVFKYTSPLGVRLATFKAPSKDELAHDYLWRCHAVVPARGEIGVWNRSHYEDVLVPVVNQWIDKDTTRQRYGQINDFERMLTETGTVILKFMLHISKEEQRLRLQERIDDKKKHWKFAESDLAARKQWKQYQAAYAALLGATSTPWAPWTIVPSNNKVQRNLFIGAVVCDTLKAMKLRYPPAKEELKGLKIV